MIGKTPQVNRKILVEPLQETWNWVIWGGNHLNSSPGTTKTFRALMLHFWNLSSAISISTVKNWVCYNKTALKVGNRSVGEEFKAVTIEAIKTGYTVPADTGLSCLQWRHLIKIVKAQSALKGFVLIAYKRSTIRQEKKANTAFSLTEASLVLVSSDADFATFWMMGAMFVGPYSCSLGRQLW